MSATLEMLNQMGYLFILSGLKQTHVQVHK